MTKKDLNIIEAITMAHEIKKNGRRPYIQCSEWNEGLWLEMKGFDNEDTLYGKPVLKTGAEIEELQIPFEFHVSFDHVYKFRWSVSDEEDLTYKIKQINNYGKDNVQR